MNGPRFAEKLGEELWSRLAERECINDSNQHYGTPGGMSPTRDRVLLLSIYEYKRFRDVIPDVREDRDGRRRIWWLLRSPGIDPASAAHVNFYDGNVSDIGYNVYELSCGVRPALSLSLKLPSD